jgi:hypothetical protein
MERIIRFYPAYDKRNPEPRQNYGICGVKVYFALKGRHGAVTFELLTDWYPKDVQQHEKPKRIDDVQPLGACIAVHAPSPQFDGQEPSSGECEFMDGKPCYCDVSYLAANIIRDLLLAEGSDGVWAELERWYTERFGVLE